MNRNERFASICLIIAMFIWGSSFVAFKYALAGYSPLVVIAARMSVASLIFLVFWKFLAGQQYRKGDWKYLLIMSLCEPCLYFVFEAWALVNTTASEAGVVTATLPLLVAALAALVLKETISKNHYLGFAITLPGVIWLTLAGEASESAPNPALGNFLEFLAMVSAAGYTVALKYVSQRYSAFFLTAIQSFIGAVFFVPLAFVFEPEMPQWHSEAAMAVVYLGVVVTMFAYGFYNFAIRHLSATQTVMFTNLIPVFTLILAFFILQERITVQQWFAAGLIIVGVLISQRKRAVRAPAVEAS